MMRTVQVLQPILFPPVMMPVAPVQFGSTYLPPVQIALSDIIGGQNSNNVQMAAYFASANETSGAGGAMGTSGNAPAGTPPAGGNGNGSDGERVSISELMKQSGVAFGTSGARGLASDITDRIAFAYTTGFLQYLMRKGEIKRGDAVAIAGDLRPSTERIMTAVATAVIHMQLNVANLGRIPSPAAALYGIENKIPSIMVTGSHIPADRNGIKFNKVAGEILKDDEAAMKNEVVTIPPIFDANGVSLEGFALALPGVIDDAEVNFIKRYIDFFGYGAMRGKRIGVYQHSAVGRDMLETVLRALGADVTTLARSNEFVPVDTEAIRPEDVDAAKGWAIAYGFDAIVSTDGDSDRPLIAGRDGKWLRGDVLGVLVSQYLLADSVSTPVSSNTAVELVEMFPNVSRTRIGSPYVIASMLNAVTAGYRRVISYEANGGFLTATDIDVDGRTLTALPTRDSFLPILAAIMLAKKEGVGVEDLVRNLPLRFTWSDRIKNFPQERSAAILAMFNTGDAAMDRANIDRHFGSYFGQVRDVNYTDGVRMTFSNGRVVHLRPSGNAPEFRAYTEAETEGGAIQLNRLVLQLVADMR